MSISGIILAGGNSSRMGTDKGWVQLNGKPLVKHIIQNLDPVCDEIIISANNSNYSGLGYDVVKDKLHQIGPIAGIYSCMNQAKYRRCLVVSCDLPLASTKLFEKIISYNDASEIIVPETNGFIQPLCGVYSKSILNKLGKEINLGNYGMRFLISKFNALILNEEKLVGINLSNELKNFNTMTDIKGEHES